MALGREPSGFHFREVEAGLAAIPDRWIALAVAVTALDHLLLSGYDLLGLRYVGRTLPLGRVVFASFIAHAFGNNVGLALLSSGSVRFRLYSQWGLPTGDVARVVAFTAVQLGATLLPLLGVALLAGAPGPRRLGSGELPAARPSPAPLEVLADSRAARTAPARTAGRGGPARRRGSGERRRPAHDRPRLRRRRQGRHRQGARVRLRRGRSGDGRARRAPLLPEAADARRGRGGGRADRPALRRRVGPHGGDPRRLLAGRGPRARHLRRVRGPPHRHLLLGALGRRAAHGDAVRATAGRTRMLCVRGSVEKDSLRPHLEDLAGVRQVLLPAGHHFDGDTRNVARLVLEAAAR